MHSFIVKTPFRNSLILEPDGPRAFYYNRGGSRLKAPAMGIGDCESVPRLLYNIH